MQLLGVDHNLGKLVGCRVLHVETARVAGILLVSPPSGFTYDVTQKLDGSLAPLAAEAGAAP